MQDDSETPMNHNGWQAVQNYEETRIETKGTTQHLKKRKRHVQSQVHELQQTLPRSKW